MRKNVLAMAVIAASLFTVSVSAQNNADCKGDRQCENNCTRNEKKDKKYCKPKACNPFEGLNLTEKQQTAIKAIPTPCEVMKAARKGACENKNEANNLKPGKRGEFTKTIRADYLKQVKQVLTAEQYTQFLENQFVNQRPQKNGQKFGNHKHHKGHKDGKKDRRNHCDAKRTDCNKNNK